MKEWLRCRVGTPEQRLAILRDYWAAFGFHLCFGIYRGLCFEIVFMTFLGDLRSDSRFVVLEGLYYWAGSDMGKQHRVVRRRGLGSATSCCLKEEFSGCRLLMCL